MEERILDELRELALIYQKRKERNSKSGCANRYAKEQKLAIVDSYVKKHIPVHELSKEFEVADDTTARELVKWDLQSKKVEIDILLDKANEEKLDEVIKLLRA